jgi:hypothetical protein
MTVARSLMSRSVAPASVEFVSQGTVYKSVIPADRERPLWVIGGHSRADQACPLSVAKQTCCPATVSLNVHILRPGLTRLKMRLLIGLSLSLGGFETSDGYWIRPRIERRARPCSAA